MRKKDVIPYAEEFFRLLSETFKNDISYRYKLLFLKNEKYNQYSVCLAIDIYNNGEKNRINFLTYKDFMKLSKEKQLDLMGNFYNAEIIGKKENEFGIKDVKYDFLKLCDFNYLREQESTIEENEEEML